MKTIGALIKAYRKELGLTQFEMAKIMQTSQSQVCKFESGILTPSLSHFARWYRDALEQSTISWTYKLEKWLEDGKL